MATANPYGDAARPNVGTLVTFGDSYTDLNGPTAPWTWSKVLLGEGSVQSIESYALGGAGASDVLFPRNTRPLNQQIDMWVEHGGPANQRPNDLTVVYFGQNDVEDNTFSISTSFSAYEKAMRRLIEYDCTQDGRWVFLVIPHATWRDPFHRDYMKVRYTQWRNFMTGLYLGLPSNFMLVDVGTVLECIYDSPHKYGFTNVRDIGGPDRSRMDYLYLDQGHFGRHGNRLIARTVRWYLTNGWNAATSETPAAMVKTLTNAVSSGHVFTSLD